MKKHALFLVAVLVAGLSATPGAQAAAAERWADFDGDGFGDLAIGAPRASRGGAVQSGAVVVMYGTADGLTSARAQVWDQVALTGETPERSDRLGEALAVGDFDGDGFDDLAIGVPFESRFVPAADRDRNNVGVVHVLYGSESGLTASRAQLWHQDVPEVRGRAQAGDRFGQALAAGDADGDGFDELAIGIPGENLPQRGGRSRDNAGKVAVLKGTAAGLTAEGNQLWSQASAGIAGAAESRDAFGSSLAFGDFGGDGFADLAVGVPFEDVGDLFDAGAVNVIPGSAQGLTASGDLILAEHLEGTAERAEPGDVFGVSLATGDVDGDGADDLAVGVPGEHETPRIRHSGTVHVWYGVLGSGIGVTGDQVFGQDRPEEVIGTAEPNDQFGTAVALADVNGDGFDDLIAGHPEESIGTRRDAGAINILFGSAAGLTATDNRFWNQGRDGLEGGRDAHDRFGAAVTGGDFDGDGIADLAVGAPNETYGVGGESAGGVNVLYGTGTGPTGADDQFWRPGADGFPLAMAPLMSIGFAVAG